MVGVPLGTLTNEISSLKSGYLTENNTQFNYEMSIERNKFVSE